MKKKKQTFTILVSVKGKAKKSFALKAVSRKARKYIKVSKKGKVIIKKGLKKGKYKIKVKITAAATKKYRKTSIIKVFKIIVK